MSKGGEGLGEAPIDSVAVGVAVTGVCDAVADVDDVLVAAGVVDADPVNDDEGDRPGARDTEGEGESVGACVVVRVAVDDAVLVGVADDDDDGNGDSGTRATPRNCVLGRAVITGAPPLPHDRVGALNAYTLVGVMT